MKTTTSYSFKEILKQLQQQNPEIKLRIAFELNEFVKKIRETGQKHEKLSTRYRTRTIA